MTVRPECAPVAPSNSIVSAPSDSSIGHRLLDVDAARHEPLCLSDELTWLSDLGGQIVRGGVYLLGGAPGAFKSGLALQLSLDLNRRDIRTLTILTEEPSHRLRERALLMTSQWPKSHVRRAFSNLHVESELADIEQLPAFLARHVLSPGGRFHGIELLVLDSIQGHGLSAAATRRYERLYEAARLCKLASMTLILVSHVTKRNEVSGPRTLEHNCDAVWLLRRSMSYRMMFVPKNRFGPCTLKPLALDLDPLTVTLKPSPHVRSMTSVARTFLGSGLGAAEVQASVALAGFGTRGKVTAPGLPKREIEQLVACLSAVDGIELNELDFTLHCRLPGSRPYHAVLGLPLCMALVSSYIQRPIPPHQIHVGEVDLLRSVRNLPEALAEDLAGAIADGSLGAPVRLLVPTSVAPRLPAGGRVEIVGCKRLDDAIFATWPDLH